MQVSKTKLKQLGIQYPFQGGSHESQHLVSESHDHQQHDHHHVLAQRRPRLPRSGLDAEQPGPPERDWILRFRFRPRAWRS